MSQSHLCKLERERVCVCSRCVFVCGCVPSRRGCRVEKRQSEETRPFSAPPSLPLHSQQGAELLKWAELRVEFQPLKNLGLRPRPPTEWGNGIAEFGNMEYSQQ